MHENTAADKGAQQRAKLKKLKIIERHKCKSARGFINSNEHRSLLANKKKLLAKKI